MNETLPANITRFRLGLFNACEDSAYCHGRFMSGFTTMAREDRRLEITIAPKTDSLATLMHTWIMHLDALFILNPVMDDHVKVIGIARACGVPVVADWGDDVLNLRPSNPAYEFYAHEVNAKPNLRQIMQMADICAVQTETQRQSWIKEFGAPAERLIILGDECRWPMSNTPRRKIVSWRGMSSHEEDIWHYLPAMSAVAADPLFADWHWLFMGDVRWNLKEEMLKAVGKDRLILSPYWPTVVQFIHAWKGMAPFVHMVPLVDNAFNRAKTANAWFEAAAVGAAVVGPDFPEWTAMPGLIPYSTGSIVHNGHQTFEEVLRRELVKWKPLRDDNGMGRSEGGIELGEMHPAVLEARAAAYPGKTQAEMNKNRWALLRKLSTIKPELPQEPVLNIRQPAPQLMEA